MKPVLVILAAGMGSRYGGLKQAEPVGPHGELIIDYSIHDAMKAGFGRVVCIIKKENLEIFKERVSKRHPKADISYVFQSMDQLPEGYSIPEGRVKPWGTAHALMTVVPNVTEPFAVINADDYYGPAAFQALADFLKDSGDETPMSLAMVGYRLANTLSKTGTVARGVCTADENGMLTSIDERLKLGWVGSEIVDMGGEIPKSFSGDTIVSMNCWAFPNRLLEGLAPNFPQFLDHMKDPLKSEYLLPEYVGNLLKNKEAVCRVLPVDAKWYGVTYREDHDAVVAAMKDLFEKGVYPETLL